MIKRARERSLKQMQRFIMQQFDVYLTPDEVDTLFRKHWDRISSLAHFIHLGQEVTAQEVTKEVKEMNKTW